MVTQHSESLSAGTYYVCAAGRKQIRIIALPRHKMLMGWLLRLL